MNILKNKKPEGVVEIEFLFPHKIFLFISYYKNTCGKNGIIRIAGYIVLF